MPKASNKRTPKVSNKPKNRIQKVKTEMHKMEKKLAKLLKLYREERPRKNQVKKTRKEDGSVKKETLLKDLRLQGLKKDSQGHLRLKNHISDLKRKFEELKTK